MKNAQGIAHFHLREKRQRNKARPPNPSCRLAGARLQLIDFHQYAAVEIVGELSHGLDRFGPRPKRSLRRWNVYRATPDVGADRPSRCAHFDLLPVSNARQPGRESPTARILRIPAADGSNACFAGFPGSLLTSCLSICLTKAGCQAASCGSLPAGGGRLHLSRIHPRLPSRAQRNTRPPFSPPCGIRVPVVDSRTTPLEVGLCFRT